MASPLTATASCDYGVVHMDSINPSGGLAAARLRLVEVWADPQIRAFARRRAGDHHVADDALQIAYLAMDRLEHLDQITNLRAYFRLVLVRAIGRERVQLGALLLDDFPRAAEAHETAAKSRRGSAAGFEDAVCTSVQAQSWHKRLVGARDVLIAALPARSDDPGRYRAAIHATAERILLDAITGEPSEADGNDAFREAYPEYFDQPGASPNTCHQRFRRARMDVRELLLTIVS
jgi:DNA-directed RNA polymerase specialized sigma24 family protein